MLACKNNFTHLKLADMLSRHEIVREYRALVYGYVKEDRGMVDAPIGRSANDRRKMAVVKEGKSAVTHFEVVDRLGELTDLKLVLETGRTHQIRVHMAYIGHPVVGDPVYASRRKNYGLAGQALHSQAITFVHPRTGETMHFEVDLPDYYSALLNSLKGNG
jgi:23S rRNA pseudouridine1911/1915/1917 synthase